MLPSCIFENMSEFGDEDYVFCYDDICHIQKENWLAIERLKLGFISRAEDLKNSRNYYYNDLLDYRIRVEIINDPIAEEVIDDLKDKLTNDNINYYFGVYEINISNLSTEIVLHRTTNKLPTITINPACHSLHKNNWVNSLLYKLPLPDT